MWSFWDSRDFRGPSLAWVGLHGRLEKAASIPAGHFFAWVRDFVDPNTPETEIPQKLKLGRPMREESFLSGVQVSIFGIFFHNSGKKTFTNG